MDYKINEKKCVCCKTIIDCNPKGNCWCKNLSIKLKEKELNNNLKKCMCKNCLINEYKLH